MLPSIGSTRPRKGQSGRRLWCRRIDDNIRLGNWVAMISYQMCHSGKGFVYLFYFITNFERYAILHAPIS